MRKEGWRKGDEDISEDRTEGTLEDSNILKQNSKITAPRFKRT